MLEEPTFSVILPVCHGGECLIDSLASLREMNYPADAFEVLVAGCSENMEAKTIVREESENVFYRLVYIECPGTLRSCLLNSACRVARGQYLAFGDDDCMFRPDWLERIHSILGESSDIGIVGGTDELVETRSRYFSPALDVVLNSFAGTGGFRKNTGPGAGGYYPKLWNMAVPRHVAMGVAIHGRNVFEESLSVHEDVELADRIRRAGKRIVFAPHIRVDHRRETTYCSFAYRNFKMASVSRSIGIHRIPHLGLILLMATIIFTALFHSSIPGRMRHLLIYVLGLYLLLILGAAHKGFKRTGSIQVFLLIPCLVFTLHFSRSVGYLWPLGVKKGGID